MFPESIEIKSSGGSLVKVTKVFKRYYRKTVRFLKHCYGKAIQHPRLLIILGFVSVAIVLLWYPQFQVSKFEITNPKDLADAENSYRATLAQIFGGFALLLGLYFTWGNLVTAKEGQITERFTRAIEQFGNEKMEIKLGGIYALGRIAKESKKDYWPIMKILTAYVREKSPVDRNPSNICKISTEIQAILEVLSDHEHPDTDVINLDNVNLNGARLINHPNLKFVSFIGSSFKKADFGWVNLESTDLKGANFERAYLWGSNLQYANLIGANLEEVHIGGADLKYAKLVRANFKSADLNGADLKEATCKEADFTNADLQNADFTGAFFLTFDQLSKARSLYNTKLDEDLANILKEKHPDLFENPITEEVIRQRMEILTSLGAVPFTKE